MGSKRNAEAIVVWTNGLVDKVSTCRVRIGRVTVQSKTSQYIMDPIAGGPVACVCPWRGAKTSQSNIRASEKIRVL